MRATLNSCQGGAASTSSSLLPFYSYRPASLSTTGNTKRGVLNPCDEEFFSGRSFWHTTKTGTVPIENSLRPRLHFPLAGVACVLQTPLLESLLGKDGLFTALLNNRIANGGIERQRDYVASQHKSGNLCKELSSSEEWTLL